MYILQLKLLLFNQAFFVDMVGILFKCITIVLKSIIPSEHPSVYELSQEGSCCAATLDNNFVKFIDDNAFKIIKSSEAAIDWCAKFDSD